VAFEHAVAQAYQYKIGKTQKSLQCLR